MLRRRPRWTRTRRAAKWSLLALSVLLFVAWFASRWVRPTLFESGDWTNRMELRTCPGAVYFHWSDRSLWMWARMVIPEGLIEAHIAETWVWTPRTTFDSNDWFVLVPLAYPAIGFGAAAGLLLIRDRRLNERRCRDSCPSCGYDLAGTPGPRCPECGADVKPREIA